jgi:hypothetical protein
MNKGIEQQLGSIDVLVTTLVSPSTTLRSDYRRRWDRTIKSEISIPQPKRLFRVCGPAVSAALSIYLRWLSLAEW